MNMESTTSDVLCELTELEQKAIMGGNAPNTTPTSATLTNTQIQSLFDFGQVG